eukprot:8188822-Karenia_brevis.AAC.1
MLDEKRVLGIDCDQCPDNPSYLKLHRKSAWQAKACDKMQEAWQAKACDKMQKTVLLLKESNAVFQAQVEQLTSRVAALNAETNQLLDHIRLH